MTAARRNEWARAARAPRGGCAGLAPGRAGAGLRPGRGGGLPASVASRRGAPRRVAERLPRDRESLRVGEGAVRSPVPRGEGPGRGHEVSQGAV